MVAKPKKPPPPPPPPVLADTKTFDAGVDDRSAFSSLISTAPAGLTRKAETVKRSLLGVSR
jgi:hypothetical protein